MKPSTKGKTPPKKTLCTIPASLTRSSSLHESVYTHAITQKYFVNRDIQSSRRATGRAGERRQCFQERRPLFKTMGRGKKTKRPLSPRLPGTSVYTCSAGSDRAHLAADLHRHHHRPTNKQEGHRHLDGEPLLIIQAERRIFTEQCQRDKQSKCQKNLK